VEINRRLYMNELTRELLPNHVALKLNLRSLVDLLLKTDPRAF
jgi:N-formylglutamate amidohydrolase